MFLVIASVSEASEGSSNFKLFDVAVDGEYFCSVRYSQLRHFHTQLRKAFPSAGVPDFPPKKLGSLNRYQLEQRRLSIEAYLRRIAHVPQTSASLLFKNFFLAAQFASWSGSADPVSLSVNFFGGETVVLPRVSPLEREELVKESFAKKVGLRKNLMQFFTFHVAHQEEDGSLSMIRQLYEMESPVITLYRGGPGRRLVFARKFWHLSVHKEVCENEAAREILFFEAVRAIEKGLWKCREVDEEKLRRASQKKNKPEFLDLVAKQSDYLSTFIGGLTVELSSGRCDGAVTIRREALQVSYRVGGGEGGAAGGYKVLGMLKWSQIMTWSLVHQGQPSIRILYKGPGPLNGCVSLSGQSVPYLAQCIRAVVVMATRLKEAVQKPMGEIPNFPKVTRTEIIWPPPSRAPLQVLPPPQQRRQQEIEQGRQGRRTQQWQRWPQQPPPQQQPQQQQPQQKQPQLLLQQQLPQQQQPQQQQPQQLPQQQQQPQQLPQQQQQPQQLPQQQQQPQLLPQQQQEQEQSLQVVVTSSRRQRSQSL